MKTKTANKLIAILLIFILVIVNANAQSKKLKKQPEKKLALEWLSQESVVEKFGKISDVIWSYAELGMQEFKSSKLLAKTLEEEGFIIERGLAGMPTCFVASYGSGKPVIGILGEFDALPMISQKGRVPDQDPVIEGAPGHGCGHNTMCTAAAAAAIAVKQVMEKFNIKGTIKVFGSPAEETVISRPFMVRAGLFDDVDFVIDNHFSSGLSTGYGVSGNALFSTIFTFKGKTAHSAGAPWSGRSALDAVELMNIACNYLREHLFYTHRLHYVITEGGEAPNVVPDKASVWYYVRNTDERVEDMYRRVVNCAKAAALATDTELIIRCLTAIHQNHCNKAAAEIVQNNIELVGMPGWTEEEQNFAKALQKELGKEEKGLPEEVDSLKAPGGTFTGGGSSDVGEVTLVVPTTKVRFPGGVPGAIGHHWSLVSCTYGSTAWKGLNTGAKVMAATAIDVFTQLELLVKIKEEFDDYIKDNPYKPFLPEGTEPPLDLNSGLMEKWSKLLQKTYIEY